MTGRGALGLAALVDCAGQPCALHSPERYTSTMNHHHVRNALVEVYSQTTWRSSARRTPCIGSPPAKTSPLLVRCTEGQAGKVARH